VGIIKANEGNPGKDYEPINKDSYWNMIGFTFYMFEGVGCLLPILKETKQPE
jgi:hypothetical protein